MRFFRAFLALAALSAAATVGFASPDASACGVSNDQVIDRNVERVSSSTLFSRAAQLEARASQDERSAAQLRATANQNDVLAADLRDAASSEPNFSARERLFERADALSSRARSLRLDANDEIAEAQTLRVQARSLRTQAAELVRFEQGNNGGHWRGRPNADSNRSATSI